MLINWSNGPSEDRGLTLIPWRLIGADKAARTQSSFTDNWVAQLNYFGARREAPSGRTRRGVTRVPFCILMYLSVAVPQVRAIIRKEKKNSANQEKGGITDRKATVIYFNHLADAAAHQINIKIGFFSNLRCIWSCTKAAHIWPKRLNLIGWLTMK